MVIGKLDNYFKFISIFLVFLLLAFDEHLALVYLMIMFTDYIWYNSDNFISFKISKGSGDDIQVFLEALAALGIFLTLSTVLVSVFDPQSIMGGDIATGAQTIFHLLSTTTPILKGSVLFTVIGWGILAPIIETSFFFGRLLEGMATYMEELIGKKISVYKFSKNLLIVFFMIATMFTLFHITSKGLRNIPLLITFIFSLISCTLVVRQKSLKGAIELHIMTNMAAVAASMGWL